MPRVRRASKEQTRALVLDAALDLVRERACAAGDDVVAAALAHVRLTDVAARAGVTTGAIYQLWPGQADFQAALVLHVADVQARSVPGLPEGGATFERARADDVPFEEVLRVTMERVRRHYLDDPLFRVELGFLPSATDPRVREALRRRADVFVTAADEAWTAMLTTYGLRVRAPWTVRHLTLAVAAQLTGSVMLSWGDPAGQADPEGDDGWSLTARAILALVGSVTEPA